MTGGVTLRRATPDDAEGIAAISVRAWAHAYEEFLDPRVLAARTVDSETERWRGLLAGSETQTWVAELDSRIVGYAATGPSADRDANAAVGEVRALYVDPPAQGAGLGSRLLRDAAARLGGAGFTSSTVWVFEQNGLGRAFYERHGWTNDPTGHEYVDPDWHAPAVRYRLEL